MSRERRRWLTALILRPPTDRHPRASVIGPVVGGTAIAEWLDTLLDDTFDHATAAGLTPTITIWIQGEADGSGGVLYLTYEANLRILFDRIEAEWGPQELIIIPLLSGGAQPQEAEINAAFAAVAADRPEIVLVATSDLPKSDNVHYTRDGYTRLAARIAAEIAIIENS